MTADPMICRATRKWLPSKSTIRWRWSREKKSSRCARSATIRWRGYIRIDISTRRSIRAGGHSRTIGRRPSVQAVDPTREYVDGVRAREPITERQRKAVLRLNRAERELGADGGALVHEVLVLGMTMEQIIQRRGLRGQRWMDYFSRRFRECLDRLALIYGFATERAAK
jgi:hypothetical protein